ncbi:MAG: hypothetical protein R3E08_02635 [Thiotrichaceae bacterium]
MRNKSEKNYSSYHGERRDGDPARLVADARLARQQLGWQPQFAELPTIIQHAWQWELNT